MCNLNNKAEQIKAIENGKGIQYILDAAYKILGNPILIHDMDYKLVARTENTDNDDPIWNEFITTGMVGHDRLIFYRDECFLLMAANAKKITFLLSDKLKYGRIFGKLFTNNNIQVGCACINACYKPFEDEDPALFEILCDILNKEFYKSEFYQNYGQVYMETLVGQLIEDSIEDIDLYTAHIESIYIGFKSYLRLAVVDITRCDPGYTKLACFRDLLKRIQPDFRYAIYANYIVIIMSSDNEIINIKDIHTFYTLFEQHDMFAGISGPFEKIFDLPKYYNDAVNTLNNGLESNSNQRIFLHDELQ